MIFVFLYLACSFLPAFFVFFYAVSLCNLPVDDLDRCLNYFVEYLCDSNQYCNIINSGLCSPACLLQLLSIVPSYVTAWILSLSTYRLYIATLLFDASIDRFGHRSLYSTHVSINRGYYLYYSFKFILTLSSLTTLIGMFLKYRQFIYNTILVNIIHFNQLKSQIIYLRPYHLQFYVLSTGDILLFLFKQCL